MISAGAESSRTSIFLSLFLSFLLSFSLSLSVCFSPLFQLTRQKEWTGLAFCPNTCFRRDEYHEYHSPFVDCFGILFSPVLFLVRPQTTFGKPNQTQSVTENSTVQVTKRVDSANRTKTFFTSVFCSRPRAPLYKGNFIWSATNDKGCRFQS